MVQNHGQSQVADPIYPAQPLPTPPPPTPYHTPANVVLQAEQTLSSLQSICTTIGGNSVVPRETKPTTVSAC